jgi:hypothetical protein
MGVKGGDLPALLKRWKKKVRSDSELRGEVREVASRLLSGARLFVEELQWLLVEQVVMESASVPLATERPVYVV